jgi:hypothetical protein
MFCVVGLAGCGDEPVTPDMAGPDLATPDLKPLPDLFMPDFAGIGCGTMTCGASQECCVTPNGMMLNATCVNKGTCDADAGAIFTCDGPEDCPTSPAPAGGCCVTINGSGGGDAGAIQGNGSAMCVDKCPGSAGQDGNGGFTAHSKLCHSKADCTGYTGTVSLGPAPTTLKFDGCCSSPMAGAYMFCAPGIAAGMAGITCQP